MWKVGAVVAVAGLLLIFLGIEFWPTPHRIEAQPPRRIAVQPLSPAAVEHCARQVLNDWVRDARFLGGYPRQCYRAVLDELSRVDSNCTTAYTIPLLCYSLKERLRASG